MCMCVVVVLIKLAMVLIKLMMYVLLGLTPYVCSECVCVCVLSDFLLKQQPKHYAVLDFLSGCCVRQQKIK